MSHHKRSIVIWRRTINDSSALSWADIFTPFCLKNKYIFWSGWSHHFQSLKSLSPYKASSLHFDRSDLCKPFCLKRIFETWYINVWEGFSAWLHNQKLGFSQLRLPRGTSLFLALCFFYRWAKVKLQNRWQNSNKNQILTPSYVSFPSLRMVEISFWLPFLSTIKNFLINLWFQNSFD